VTTPATYTRRFFARDSLTVARALVGGVLVHETRAGVSAGLIVEVEAYRGPSDRAAHSYGGRRTARNEVMYGAAGHSYVYFIYGIHYCINVVTGAVDVPEAVLIRALEPVDGLALMRRRRGLGKEAPAHLLCRGPGNVCRAMGIQGRDNGADLLCGALRIERGRRVPEARIVRAARIGVDYAGDHAALPWRLYDGASRSVSRAAGAGGRGSGLG